MHKQIFVNLAVADLPRSRAFFSRRATEVLTCLSCDSRAEVDALVAKAVQAGGRAHRQPQDHGFMYAHGFEDPDGHIWELSYMDMSALPPQ